jgi:hypothetical protein
VGSNYNMPILDSHCRISMWYCDTELNRKILHKYGGHVRAVWLNTCCGIYVDEYITAWFFDASDAFMQIREYMPLWSQEDSIRIIPPKNIYIVNNSRAVINETHTASFPHLLNLQTVKMLRTFISTSLCTYLLEFMLGLGSDNNYQFEPVWNLPIDGCCGKSPFLNSFSNNLIIFTYDISVNGFQCDIRSDISGNVWVDKILPKYYCVEWGSKRNICKIL